MKKLSCIYSITALLFIVITAASGCKKDTDTTNPTFDVTATTVVLQGGGDGLQFYAKSTNVDVKMTSVVIVDPDNAPPFPYTYDFNGAEFSTNQSIGLQENNVAYEKEIGTWEFTFTGTRISDGGAFVVETTLAVNN